jgi:hypothetical protein
MSTTFEEAKECPKCGKPGDDRRQTRSRNARGAYVTLHHIYCVSELCPWYNTMYIVQVNEDGSIPEAYSGVLRGGKAYPTISQESASRIEENILRQLEAETKPGGEVRNPKA